MPRHIDSVGGGESCIDFWHGGRSAIQPLQENWVPTKPARVTRDGIVVAQNAIAASIGAAVLAEGGNAADAAVATAFALGVVEPWMSGIGGVGFFLYGEARTQQVRAVDFTTIAAAGLDPARYALVGGVSPSLFGWPKVVEDRNLKGYESIGVPGAVDGLGLAVEAFGRKSLAELIAPAIRLAEEGLRIDWYTMLSVAVAAADLAEFPASRELYLPNGLPPVVAEGAVPGRLPMPALAATYRRIAEAGRRDFYEGELAGLILADLEAGGSPIRAADFAGYRARLVEPTPSIDYRGVTFHHPTELTGGPTFAMALQEINRRLAAVPGSYPDEAEYVFYADALRAAFTERFRSLGQGGGGAAASSAATAPDSCTTHISAVDRDGNMASLTNTLLSRFGSKVVLPRTGVLMNNGMMWFDPVPGGPNSIAPGRRPLANLCPVLGTRDGVPWVAMGASGGRRIISAMVQFASFLVDFNMPLEKAFELPRLDASGEILTCSDRFPAGIVAALRNSFEVEIVEETLYPSPFAVPSAVMRPRSTNMNTGMAHIHSPAAAAIAEGA
jgi:gamma-glutamyltranspeptidase/glutathione hydrolase